MLNFKNFCSCRLLRHFNSHTLGFASVSISRARGQDHSFQSGKFLSYIRRSVASSAQFENLEEAPSGEVENASRLLCDVFMEAVGLAPRAEGFSGESDVDNRTGENECLKRKLRELEEEVRNLNADSELGLKEKEKEKKERAAKPKSLYAVFTKQPAMVKKDEPVAYKELSKDMEVFVYHLYKHGYFNNANFLRRDKLDFSCFDDSYGRDFIKFAAEMFAKDNQEVAK